MNVRSAEFFSFDRSLENNFHIVEKSRQDIQATQLFLLGNTYYRQDQQFKISWLIQKLYREGDIVLVETYRKNPKKCSETQFFAKKINSKGWDSKIREKEFEQHACLMNILLLIDRVRRNFHSQESWVDNIHQLIRMFPPHNEIHDKIINELCSKEKLAELKTSKERLDYFNDVVVSLATIWLAYLQKELVEDLDERNACLISQIDKHLTASPRIFVIAGIAHLTLDPRFNTLDDAERSVNLVQEYLKDKKYIILYPNGNNGDLQKIKEELRPSMSNRMRRLMIEQEYYTLTKVILIGSVICLGFTALVLPFLILSKTRNYFSIRDPYRESLRKLSIEELLILISYVSENPSSLPREVGTIPLNQSQEGTV